MAAGGGHVIRLVVRGASMAPTLADGDFITLDTGARRPMPGDVIALAVDGEVIVHRYLGRTARGTLITAGDARLLPDAPSPAEALRGVIPGFARRGRHFRRRRRAQIALLALRENASRFPLRYAQFRALWRALTPAWLKPG